MVACRGGTATTTSTPTSKSKKLDDLKGKKIRALGVYGKYVQLLGASPVVDPRPEM